ncbi:conserved hypothetical protein [Leishmania major strain Friedlin]|uniref:REH2 DRSM domain-containing protein n=1 Tax=Leishmania major TaxID=5664 RepID=Q4QEP6_LEIMA|nr:conserved hypothetical protein [Leishmania major strain Friedlin]CAG9572162.1 hypothetical_protein_-_conserved [Leishmania major strain Friedlin]CAJ03940.1 conserved hypothetical protein [Leishmania major strain Friedlin]|eukprot:XP_001682202.1 conserved hypothetical protein [Leishmania major strain Friedlin]
MQHPPVTTVGAHAPLKHRVRSLWRVLPLSTKSNRWVPLMESWETALQHTRNAAVLRIQRSSNCRGFTASAGGVSSHALLVGHRTCCSSASSSSSWKPPSSAGAATAAAAAEPEMISLDAIEIEVVSAEESPSTTSTTATVRHAEVHRETPFPGHRNHCVPHPHCHHHQRQREVSATDFFTAQLHATSAAGGREYDSDGASTASAARVVSGSGETETGVPVSAVQRQEDYCDAHTIDAFARGRISNFVRRMGHRTGTVFHVRVMTPAQAAAVTGSTTGPTLFAATCRLPLPEPHGSRVAEGVAEDAKEAELLAAMHAERVCDALGVQLFRLRTAQQKHADAVRKEEGRYAPYPDDPIKPLGTPIPPPLRLLRSRMHTSSNAPGAASARSVFSVATEVAAADAAASSQSHRYTAERGEASAATVTAPRVQRSHLARTPPAPREGPLAGQALPAESAESGAGEDDSASASPATAGAATSFESTKIVLRRHDPIDDYAQLVFHYTDEEHAERVRTYASSVYYPWMCQWEGGAVAQGDVSATPQGGAMGSDGTAAAATLGQVFDPTENGMWSMVNDRDMRCSPTPHDALVLPIVYDGPCAEARITDYYTQHNTTLKEHLMVRSASGSAGSPQRMVEAELRLVGLTIAAKGKAQTEPMAIHLAAMHAELLLDALGHPLFPADPQRQARHAEVVAGYGRWAMNPLTGAITPPNPHDALPLPLKIQIGTDDVWLGPEARRQLGHRWSDSEHIIVAMQHLNSQTEDEVEINPPAVLLEEAEQLLQEWQAHVAESRFTHLFVLFNMDNVFQATTLLPVPRRFGIRGGLGIGKTRKMAVQVCSLHALDTLCTLGVPLCVDPERQRRYLQRRAALGMVLQRTSPADEGSLKHARVPRSFSGLPPPPLPSAAERSPGTSDGGVLRLPTYVVEGSHIRLLPNITDTLHTMQLRIPEDYCLFGGASEEVLVEIGNQVRMAVQNYLQECLGKLLRSRNMQQRIQSNSGASRAVQCAAAAAGAGDAVVEDNIAETQAWATQFAMNLLPHNIIRGYGRQNSLHNTSFLQVPIPSSAVLPSPEMSHKIDASAVSLPPHPLMGPVYAIAIGTSLKRKDAERACYLHAASILHSFGVDVLVQYPRGQPRVRHACSFADVAKYLSKEPLIITSPFLSDGTLRASAVEAAGVKPTEAVSPPPSTSEEIASASSASSAPQPGSLHPPRPVMHTNMKAFLESTRGITLPRKRKARFTSPF